MARKKVSLRYITNDSTRRATLRKRRRGLIKKVSELATLCGVKACAVIYEPGEAEPEVWPDEREARNILQRFKALPVLGQCKKMMSQEEFLGLREKKLNEQLCRQIQENRKLEMNVLMLEGLAGKSVNDLGIEESMALAYHIEVKRIEVHEWSTQTMKVQTTTTTTTTTLPIEARSEAPVAVDATNIGVQAPAPAPAPAPTYWSNHRLMRPIDKQMNFGINNDAI